MLNKALPQKALILHNALIFKAWRAVLKIQNNFLEIKTGLRRMLNLEESKIRIIFESVLMWTYLPHWIIC
jgi:hypothetical protein